MKAKKKRKRHHSTSTSGNSIIGGMFGLHLLESNVKIGRVLPPAWRSGSLCEVATARSAVRLLVRSLRPARVWLPSYICGVVVEAAREPGVRLRFYPVGQSLQIEDDKWLSRVERDDLVLFVDYFGFEQWSECGARAKAKGARIVEDACQAMLNDSFCAHSDYVLFSPRKFIGVPDGGILLATRTGDIPIDDLPAPPPDWLLLALKASILRSAFDLHGGDRLWFNMFQWAETNGPLGPCRMSELSKMILQTVNWREIRDRRRQNYKSLLSGLGEFAIFPKLPREVVPLGFPIRVRHRDQLRKALFREQIYPAVHWDIIDVIPPEFAASHRLAAEIMTLPSDQRYNRNDMNRMVSILKRHISA